MLITQETNATISTGVAAVEQSVDLGNGRRLVAVEMIEVASGGRQVYDVGHIGLITGRQPSLFRLSLKLGHLALGNSLRWQGDLCLNQPILLFARWEAPPSGAVCYMHYAHVGEGDVTHGGHDDLSVVQTYPVGQLEVISQESVATAASLAVVIPQEYQWLVQDGWCYHDDTSSHTLAWGFNDGVSQIVKTPSASIAANVQHPWGLLASASLGAVGQLMSCRCYPVIIADGAMGAGKKIFAKFLVLKFGLSNA